MRNVNVLLKVGYKIVYLTANFYRSETNIRSKQRWLSQRKEIKVSRVISLNLCTIQ